MDHIPSPHQDRKLDDLLADLRDAGVAEALVDRVADLARERDVLATHLADLRADAAAAEALARAVRLARD